MCVYAKIVNEFMYMHAVVESKTAIVAEKSMHACSSRKGDPVADLQSYLPAAKPARIISSQLNAHCLDGARRAARGAAALAGVLGFGKWGSITTSALCAPRLPASESGRLATAHCLQASRKSTHVIIACMYMFVHSSHHACTYHTYIHTHHCMSKLTRWHCAAVLRPWMSAKIPACKHHANKSVPHDPYCTFACSEPRFADLCICEDFHQCIGPQVGNVIHRRHLAEELPLLQQIRDIIVATIA